MLGTVARRALLASAPFLLCAPATPAVSPAVDLATTTVAQNSATGQPPAVTATGPAAVGMVDQFSGPAGTSPSSARWRFDLGGGGWGNNEAQSYTGRPSNARLDGAGSLLIDAHNETYTGTDGLQRWYTSARLVSRQTFTYGTFSARIKAPVVQGTYPAFWLLGDNIDTVGWPACGELDVMELTDAGRTLYATAHGPTTDMAQWWGYARGARTYLTAAGAAATAGWHTYSTTWTPSSITWSVDGRAFGTVKASDLSVRERWVFDHPHRVILNVAVGGNSGWPTAGPLSAVMSVDWVKVTPM